MAAHAEIRLTSSFCARPASVNVRISSFCRCPTTAAAFTVSAFCGNSRNASPVPPPVRRGRPRPAGHGATRRRHGTCRTRVPTRPNMSGNGWVARWNSMTSRDGDHEIDADEQVQLPHPTRSTSSKYRAGSNTTNRVGPYRSNSGPLMRRNRVLHRQLVQLELGGHRPDLRHVGPVQPDPGQPVAVPQHLVGFLQTARIGGAVPLTYTALSISVTAVPRFLNPSTLGAQRAVCVAAAGRSAAGPITP